MNRPVTAARPPAEADNVVAFQMHRDRSIASDSLQVHLVAVRYENAGFERFLGVSCEHWSEILRAKLIAPLKRIDIRFHEFIT